MSEIRVVLVENATFAKPHFIEQLGEEGLTAGEIAKSLQVPVEAVHRKLRRGQWMGNVPAWRVMPYVMNSENSRLYDSFALNVRAAKAFVARWENAIGTAYLDFLFDCEQATMEIIPQLTSLVQESENRISELERAIQRKKRKKELKLIAVPAICRPGSSGVVSYELTPRGDATRIELLLGKLRHQKRTMAGIERNMNATMAQLGFID